MLAVTSVEGCRYCSYFLSKLVLKGSVSQEKTNKLLSGEVEDCFEEETLTVLFAQHRAESNACPDKEAVESLEEAYGPEKAEAINLMLRLIRFGNLVGNSWDYLLYRISFGKWCK